MQKTQRNILAIIIPIVAFFLGCGFIAAYVKNMWTPNRGVLTPPFYNLHYTWSVWLIILIIVGIIEILIFQKNWMRAPLIGGIILLIGILMTIGGRIAGYPAYPILTVLGFIIAALGAIVFLIGIIGRRLSNNTTPRQGV